MFSFGFKVLIIFDVIDRQHPSQVLKNGFNMCPVTFTWISLDLLATLRAYETSRRVHIMAYMMEPITEAYGTLLMRLCSSFDEGHYLSLKSIPCDIGKNPLLDCSMLNRFNILFMYVSCLNPISLLDLSL